MVTPQGTAFIAVSSDNLAIELKCVGCDGGATANFQSPSGEKSSYYDIESEMAVLYIADADLEAVEDYEIPSASEDAENLHVIYWDPTDVLNARGNRFGVLYYRMGAYGRIDPADAHSVALRHTYGIEAIDTDPDVTKRVKKAAKKASRRPTRPKALHTVVLRKKVNPESTHAAARMVKKSPKKRTTKRQGRSK